MGASLGGFLSNIFSLADTCTVITGGAGFLGKSFASALVSAGGISIILDNNQEKIDQAKIELAEHSSSVQFYLTDSTNKLQLERVLHELAHQDLQVTGLINNLAANPPMSKDDSPYNFLDYPVEQWNSDLGLGLTSAFVCSQVFGGAMAESGFGAIVNISSDLGIISPDQRIYRDPKLPESSWTEKPVSYSVTKTGIIGLTRFLATYWAQVGVRTNCIAPGAVNGNQSDFLKEELVKRVPMGRLASKNELEGVLVFLLSQASSYINGAVIPVDGGRTIW